MLETFSWYKNIIKTGNAKPANIELKETYLVKNKLVMNTKAHNPAAGKCNAQRIPNKVAIPFPPLKPAKIGKI